ncbi:hypothetical protein NDU88_007075 [Pleurodeles waltl]|uniref:Uncharacterized protein n=1 Tax=Pleurodeles waltl TaxID=8319 RepID=A0AAV7VPF5_PLEWA|nr:hypothetical protein NDU88_007075 [Pleurodeles waltl]
MGRIGRKRDMEQRSGTCAEEMTDRPGPKNTSPEDQSGDPTLQDVLRAITASRVALEGKIYALVTDLTVLRDDHRRLAEKVATTDRQLKELLPEVNDTTTKTQEMEKQIRDLEFRAEDAENRSWRKYRSASAELCRQLLAKSSHRDGRTPRFQWGLQETPEKLLQYFVAPQDRDGGPGGPRQSCSALNKMAATAPMCR